MGEVKLPRSVRVGHRTYKIAAWPHKEANPANKYGECSSQEGIIRVDTYYSIEQVRDTLLHEIMHAIYREWGLQDEDKEERTVATMATALTQVMADSPECRKWFADAWAK